MKKAGLAAAAVLIAGYFFPVRCVAQYTELTDAIKASYYYGNNVIPEPAKVSEDKSGFTISYLTKEFDVHSYSLAVSDNPNNDPNNLGNYGLYYWDTSWGESIDFDDITIVDKDPAAGVMTANRRAHHPDTVYNRQLKARASIVRKNLAKYFSPVVLAATPFSYETWKTNKDAGYSEKIDLDNDGKADVDLFLTIETKTTNVTRAAKTREYYNGNFQCMVPAYIKDIWYVYKDKELHNYRIRRNDPPPFTSYSCSYPASSYTVDRALIKIRIFSRFSAKGPLAIDSSAVFCSNEKDMVCVYGKTAPVLKTTPVSWAVNDVPADAPAVNPDGTFRLVFPKSRLKSSNNTLRLNYTIPALTDPVKLKLPDGTSGGCARFRELRISGKCIAQQVMVDVSGRTENFTINAVYLDNIRSTDVQLENMATRFRVNFPLVNTANTRRLVFKNSKGDSLSLVLFTSDLYDSCRTAVQECKPPVTPVAKNAPKIIWLYPGASDQITVSTSRTEHVEAYILTDPAAEPSVKLVNSNQKKNLEVGDLAAVYVNRFNDSLPQAKLIKEKPGKFFYSGYINLGEGENLVRVLCRTGNDSVYSEEKQYIYRDSTSILLSNDFVKTKTRLFVISVGVNKYQDKNIPELRFSRKDATDLDSVFNNAGGALKLYSEIKTYRLLDNEATLRAIIDTIRSIPALPTDLIIFNFSGHGLIANGDYYMTNYDIVPTSDRIYDTGLRSDILNTELNKHNCHYLVFIDACHSGKAIAGWMQPGMKAAPSIDDLELALETFGQEMKSEKKISMVYASCLRNKLSEDSYKYENGLLTEALLRAFGGVLSGGFTPDYDGNGILTTDELQIYLRVVVPFISDKTQYSEVKGYSHASLPLFIYKN